MYVIRRFQIVIKCANFTFPKVTSKWFPAGATRVGSKDHTRRDVHELANDETKGSSSVWVNFWVTKTGFEIGFTEEDVLIFVCDANIPNADQVREFDFTKGDWGFILC